MNLLSLQRRVLVFALPALLFALLALLQACGGDTTDLPSTDAGALDGSSAPADAAPTRDVAADAPAIGQDGDVPDGSASDGGVVTLVSVAITPPAASLATATRVQLDATGVYSDQSTTDVTVGATWSSDAAAVATVSDGLVTAVGVGVATITATVNGISGTATITVLGATVTTIAVTPLTATTGVGGSVPFAATATLSDLSTQDVTSTAIWTSSSPSVASVTGAGIARGVGAGTSTLRATVGAISGQATLTVNGAALVSIALTPANPVLGSNVTVAFTATATYSDGSIADVTATATWASSSLATATITAAGVVSTGAPGTSILTATIGSVVGQTTLTVTAATLTSITITPAQSVLALQGTETLAATGRYSDGSTAQLSQSVTWSSSASGTASVSNTAGAEGRVTALAAGTATIKATLGNVTGTAQVTVSPATLVSIAITPAAPSTPKTTTVPFVARGTYSDGSVLDVTVSVAWSTDSAAIATISNAPGTHGVASALGVGTTGVHATLGAVAGSTTLTVTPAVLQSITLTPAAPTLVVGTKQLMKASGNYSDGTVVDLTATVVWTTASAGVAVVSNAAGAEGLLTATGAGTTSVTATLGAIVGVTSLTVTSPTLAQIVVSPISPSIPSGEARQLTAMAIFTNGTQQNVTTLAKWTTSNAVVAAVSATGRATTLSAGTAQITATYGGASGATTITVTSAVVTSIDVSPIAPTLAPGTLQQFQATAIFSDSTSQNVTNQATWISSSPSVAGVNPRGRVTALTRGSTQVTATFSGLTGSSDVTVTAATVVSISMFPASLSVTVGTQRQLTAQAIYSDGSSKDVTVLATWQSSNRAVAGVSDGLATRGIATAIAPGTATLTASYQGLSGTASMTVTAATITSIEISPPQPSVAKGVPLAFTATAIFSDNTSQNVTGAATWTSSAPGVAQVSDAAGTKGLTQTLAAGSTTVAATWHGAVGSTKLTVTPATLTTIQVTPFAPTLPVGFATQFAATGIYSDNTTADLTALATWTSGAPGVAAVSTSGTTKGRVTPLAPGSATINAFYQGAQGTVAAVVTSGTLTSITVTPATTTMARFATRPLTATGQFSDGSSLDVTVYVTWLSSTPSIASVSNASGTQGVATGLGAGTVTVTAVRGTIQGTASITVQ
jgi:uncharacterized protein YjdB